MAEMVSQGSHSHRKVTNTLAPETRIGEEGTAKRNVQRKNSGSGRSKGGGQKGMWDATDDGSMQVPTMEPGDPSYDPDEDENNNYILVSDSSPISPHAMPMLTLSEFKTRLSTILEEFFLSEDIDEALRSISELDSSAYHYEIVKRGVNMSLDRKDHERELISKLLSAAYPHVLGSGQVGKGFERLFEMIDDIQLDAPAACPLVAAFLARAVVDEILPPSFLRSPSIASLGGEIVEAARRMLSRDHVLSRVEKVWGPGDGRPVEELKVAIDMLLKEYLLSRQLDEAAQCIKDLGSPPFHHEVIKRAVKTAIDSRRSDEDSAAISSLLAYLHKNEVVSPSQMKMGFDRIYEALPDILLDSPGAQAAVDGFVVQAQKDGCLPSAYCSPEVASA